MLGKNVFDLKKKKKKKKRKWARKPTWKQLLKWWHLEGRNGVWLNRACDHLLQCQPATPELAVFFIALEMHHHNVTRLPIWPYPRSKIHLYWNPNNWHCFIRLCHEYLLSASRGLRLQGAALLQWRCWAHGPGLPPGFTVRGTSLHRERPLWAHSFAAVDFALPQINLIHQISSPH